jgi:lysophospholipid acyltransferase (LPLAT)-like uncharacterized protein
MSAGAGDIQRRAESSKPRSGRPVVPHRATVLQRCVAWLLFAVISLISATLRYRWVDKGDHFVKPGIEPAIYCVWHNRLALCLPIYNRFARTRNQTPGMAAMASASKDGAFLAAIIEQFGVRAARGSSSRRGHQALLELTSWAGKGYDLAITPDGPRGPRYKVQPGVISLAQITGLPIVPCTYNLSWKIKVRSWDAFQIPIPFSKCEVIAGETVRIPRQTTDEEREDTRRQIERILTEDLKD